MPCTDVTENLRLSLDSEERLKDYELSKQTCGGAVAGRGLIRKWVKHKNIDQILKLTAVEVLAGSDLRSGTDEYLHLKHLFSLQGALGAFVGTGSQSDGFLSIESVDYGLEGVEIRARIDLKLLTDRIQACGLCGNCSGTTEP
ncbi:MAG: hypothetical protein GY867_02745 [bacterium]|nr:hypothetical protein [bacterium]